MESIKPEKKKALKKHIEETVYSKLANSLLEYKDVISEKRKNRILRKVSKELAFEINKSTKQAEQRKEKLAKKTEKLKNTKKE